MVHIVVRPEDKRPLSRLKRLWEDPFYYALRLPSIASLLFFALLVLAVLSIIMMGVWKFIKWAATGEEHFVRDQKGKMFIASATVSIYTILAGIIHRRMTMPSVRGKFVAFSKSVRVKNGQFVLSIVDKRKTQLIGTNLTLEIITTGVDGIDKVTARRVGLGSPGILAIPTEVSIPIGDVFPSLLSMTSCDICGQADFSLTGYAAHMAFRHGVDKALSKDEIHSSLSRELQTIELFRIVLTGTDEVSGKGGIAVKEYNRRDIKVSDSSHKISDGTFEILRDYEVESSDDASSSSDEETTTVSSKSAYVHIDFKFN